MIREFSLSNDKVMMNFTKKYCNNFEDILESNGFKNVLTHYLNKKIERKDNIFKYFLRGIENLDEFISSLIKIIELLTIFDRQEVVDMKVKYAHILEDKYKFDSLIDDFYSYWIKLERYTILTQNSVSEGIIKLGFVSANTRFTNLIMELYRKVKNSVTAKEPLVYRQLKSGNNASIVLNNYSWDFKNYEIVKDIKFMDTISLETPFISYPKKNTRSGSFEEIFENPLLNCEIESENWFCYPAKVGELLAFIYFHRDFMANGIALSNLFEMAHRDEYIGVKPDIVYLYGAEDITIDKNKEYKTVFYDDKENEILVGLVTYSKEVDYFGYLKKMTLTLHNISMIKRGYLPIHGAMVSITLKDGTSSNIVIVGDSGAGKSESLEAFRSLGEEYISDMTIIFDDMGVLKIAHDGVYGYGTEIGAFVRLDDLDQGYAFKEIDRSIFMNPDKTNARLVMPVSNYRDIIMGNKVDLFLYANNYEKAENGTIKLYSKDQLKDVLKVFRDGNRFAKGTTHEKGLVSSYFANPFGPMQKKDETDILLDKYFKKMFEFDVKIGEIKTCLGIDGMEKDGPKNAALDLFDMIKNKPN